MVTAALILGSTLAFAIGVAHSVLGERYILIRLFRRADLPHSFGDDWFTRRTLRFAWHLTTVSWWGFGGILLAFAVSEYSAPRVIVLWVTAVVFFVSAVLAAGFTHGRHLSWVVFLFIAVVSSYAATAS